MSDPKIDYNRGVHKQKTVTGIEVYMFLDEPGVYYSAQGSQLPEEVASEAGFPIDKWRKLRLKKERTVAFNKALEEELEIEGQATKKVIKEREGWAISTSGFGKFFIEDPDGMVISNRTLTKAEAEKIFDKLVPPPIEAKGKKSLSEEKAAAQS